MRTVWQYVPTFTAVPGGDGVFGPIRDGMKRMARTTRVLREAPVACAAKTGSPQLADTLPGGGHYVNSVLIGYAPADDPQIAMAVVLESCALCWMPSLACDCGAPLNPHRVRLGILPI